ncbi:PAS domain-containing protein [Neorhizobium sp. NPDC001467]|uniref:PAS domain-containing protein n=1 Tax=Neorhizobium sp. NPDC001467 TaxID=3390595 RepID=UPI003D0830FB
MRNIGTTFHAEVEEAVLPEIGFFTWDISDNTLYADGALAALFGLDPADTADGLPIEAYLKRVHVEDRSRLAKTIRDSIVADRPQQETYRVCNSHGQYTLVTGYGRGFRNRTGDTVRYVGVVIPALGNSEPVRFQ